MRVDYYTLKVLDIRKRRKKKKKKSWKETLEDRTTYKGRHRAVMSCPKHSHLLQTEISAAAGFPSMESFIYYSLHTFFFSLSLSLSSLSSFCPVYMQHALNRVQRQTTTVTFAHNSIVSRVGLFLLLKRFLINPSPLCSAERTR